MIEKLFSLIATVTLLLAATSEWAKADSLQCSMQIPATVDVKFMRTPMQYSANMGLEEMRQAAAGSHAGIIVGGYRLTIGYAVDIDSTTLEIRPGYFCSIPKYIMLNVKLEQVTYIPRAFAGDDCLAALAREHEAKHSP